MTPFDLMDEAFERGEFDSTATGVVWGAAIYTAANWHLARRGARWYPARDRHGGETISGD